MKKAKKSKVGKLLLFIDIFLLLILIPILVITFKKDNNKFIGTWTTDGVTVYKFNKDKTGALVLPLSKYTFVYEIKDDVISIDFDDSKLDDSKYTYLFKDDKLVLENDDGVFTFSKED